LERRAKAICAVLQGYGAEGERALLLYPPGLDYIAAFFGCLYARMIAVPAYPPHQNRNPGSLRVMAADAQASFALTTSPVLSKINLHSTQAAGLDRLRWLTTETIAEGLAEEWRESKASNSHDIAYLQYTSGSTTAPKGIMISHANVLYNSAYIQKGFEHTRESLSLSWLPHYHDMGLIDGIIQPLYSGFPCILMSPAAFLQRPLRWLQAISRYGVTHSGGPNSAYDLCVRRVSAEQRETLDLSSWSVAYNGAEPIRHETLERFLRFFEPCGFRRNSFYPAYGLAEATLKVSGGRKDDPPVTCTVQKQALEQHRVVEAVAVQEQAQPRVQGQTASPSTEEVRTLVGAGQVTLETEVVIVDQELLVGCAPDEVGEIWVAGPGVASSYWNRPEETVQTFRAYRADNGSGPYLRTGDLGFFKDGELFITGRVKDVIIIRGRNHYPQDIELTVEESHPALRPNSGVAFAVEAAGEERLVVVQEIDRHHQKLDLDEVFKAMRRAVSEEHELQVYAAVLIRSGSIPKTSSGKVRRRTCRAAFLERSLNVVAESILDTPTYAAAEEEDAFSGDALLAAGADERQLILTSHLVTLAARKLSLSPSGLDAGEPLNKLGLDSLIATELSADIADKLGVDVSPADFLRGLSISEIVHDVLTRWSATVAAEVKEVAAHNAEPDAAQRRLPPLRRASANGGIPLSFAQQRLWFLDQLAHGSPFYNLSAALRFKGQLNVLALEQSLNEIIKRHEVLRTTFVSVDWRPVQNIAPESSLSWRLVDLNKLPAARREHLIRRLSVQEAQRPFDLTRDVLLRAVLVRLEPQESVLLLTMHHIVFDAWSMAIFNQELTAFYNAFAGGRRPALPDLPVQYADFACWQRQWLQGQVLEEQLGYWKKQLGGKLPILQLPTDRLQPPIQTFRGATHFFHLPQGLSEDLKALSRREGVTLFMTLLAGFKTLLYCYTGQEDVLVGAPIANRNRSELMGLIGFFANTLVLRTDLSGNPTFRELLSRVRDVALGAYAHQDLPFEKLVETLQPERNLSRMHLLQVLFVLQNVPVQNLELSGVTVNSLDIDNGTSRYDLKLFLSETPEGLKGGFEYSTDLFDATTIARMAGHFLTLLNGIVAHPERRLSDLPLLTEAEGHQLLPGRDNARADYRTNICIHELFEEAMKNRPDAVAVAFQDERLTYRELNRRANRLAHYLRARGVGPEVLVGICVERSLEMVVGIFGILKAGGAYVPFDPAYPKERLAYMFKATHLSLLLTQAQLAARLPAHDAQEIYLDLDWPSIAQQNDESPESGVAAANLAYVIYTSGSSGEPKGVMVSHANLCHYVQSLGEALGIRPDDVYLQTASIAFSSSVRQLMMPLTYGAVSVVATPEQKRDPLALFDLVKQQGVTIIDIVPTHWRACTEALAPLEPATRIALLDNNLRLFLSASEALLSDLPTTWSHVFKHNARLINMYGQTETTGIATLYPIPSQQGERTKIVPLGRPITNMQVYVLDMYLRPLPIGAAGEVYISGADIARGYLDQPQMTALKFIPHPFSDIPGQRLYKTGDMGRFLPDGSIEYLGRTDQQVKMRGIRIELGEIEAALGQHPAVWSNVVVCRDDTLGNKRLIAYVVVQQQQQLKTGELREFLKKRIPDYMVPSAFVLMEAIPLTPNGKINSQALPSPEWGALDLESAFVPPRTPVEEVIAKIWSELLGVEQIGVHDNFFDLGGHSLLVTQMLSRICNAFQVSLPMHKLFEHPTVGELALLIQQSESQPEQLESSRIRPLPRGGKSIDQLFSELENLFESETRDRSVRPTRED
jgi:amino acid adenylation domain-containing protein